MAKYLTGKTILITGASSGIGAVAARTLAPRGVTVVPIGCSPQATGALAAELGAPAFLVDYTRLDDGRPMGGPRRRAPHHPRWSPATGSRASSPRAARRDDSDDHRGYDLLPGAACRSHLI